jgi:hypothetical protein
MNRFHRSRRKRPTLQEAEQFIKNGHGSGMRTEDYVPVGERKKRLIALAAELEAKLKQHLPRSRNLELVVLKCHLLVEYMFNQYIDLIAPTEGVIDAERFTFKQKESLVHMLGFPPNPYFFPTADLLNSIRNTVAHTLTIDRQKVDKLILLNSEHPEDAKGLSDTQRSSALKSITKFMCWQMLGAIEAKHEIEWMMEEKMGEQESGHVRK